MKQNLILTAVGPDRIGLVERISEFTVQHDCNIEDSKMAVFCGEFALILLLSGEEAKLSRLAGAADQLASLTGLNVWAKTPSARKPAGRKLPRGKSTNGRRRFRHVRIERIDKSLGLY